MLSYFFKKSNDLIYPPQAFPQKTFLYELFPRPLVTLINNYLTPTLTFIKYHDRSFGNNGFEIVSYNNNVVDISTYFYGDQFSLCVFGCKQIFVIDDHVYLTKFDTPMFFRITKDMMNSYVDLRLGYIYSTICVHNNIMYNIGGLEQSEPYTISNKVIKLDVQTYCTYKDIHVTHLYHEYHSSMNYSRLEAGVVVSASRNRIYVVGGATIYNKSTWKIMIWETYMNDYVGRTMEYYDDFTKKWIMCNSKMIYSRRGCMVVVVAHNNKLLVTGGYSTSEEGSLMCPLFKGQMRKTEIFNFLTQKWEEVGELNNAYAKIQLLVYEGKVICFGRKFSHREVGVEIFNFGTNMWVIDHHFEKLYEHGIVAFLF